MIGGLPMVVAAIAVLSISVSLGTLAAMWRGRALLAERLALLADQILKLEAAVRELEWQRGDEIRAARQGTAGFETEQKGKVHDLRNRMVAYEVRLEELERLQGIVRPPLDATGQGPTARVEPDDTPPGAG